MVRKKLGGTAMLADPEIRSRDADAARCVEREGLNYGGDGTSTTLPDTLLSLTGDGCYPAL
jgi:hypothetical protein